MPLEEGKSKEAFSHNVKAEMAAGKPQEQAVAIAYSKQGEGKDCDPGDPVPAFPESLTPAQLNAINRKYWVQR